MDEENAKWQLTRYEGTEGSVMYDVWCDHKVVAIFKDLNPAVEYCQFKISQTRAEAKAEGSKLE